MTYEQNVRAILESNFTGFKDEIIDIACRCICELADNPYDRVLEIIDTSQTYKMTAVKSCPFCGNDDVVLMTRRGKDGWRDRFYVLCDYNDDGCGASGGWYHYSDEAVEAWNRRDYREA